MSMQSPELVPVTYIEFLKALDQVSNGEAPTIDLVKQALKSAFTASEQVQQMIRQSQSLYGRQAKLAPEPNPQNAPERVAEQRNDFQPHPELAEYLGKQIDKEVNKALETNRDLLQSFAKHNEDGAKDFNELVKKLQNKLKKRYAPAPVSTPKPRPDR
ncbi:MAG: hypothetical protein U1E78_11505 [Gammaproteobacteria bacterium]